MIEILFWLAVISGAVASLVAWYYHEAAAGAKAWISIYAEEAATARADADDLQTWCDAWEERAAFVAGNRDDLLVGLRRLDDGHRQSLVPSA